MQNKYQETKQLNLPSIEAEIQHLWEELNCFEESIAQRAGAEAFVFYEGPPSANGLPGIHHVISRTIKDLFCRYKTMKGFQVKRKAGWDTHGLPVELGVEKELGITKEDIGISISVEEYNNKCREAVMRYKDKWDSITQKMGYWVDLDNPYITFENNYIESLWWCLKELFNKNLLYKSVSIQPYSPAAGTGLSSHELNQPGTYKNVKDTTVVAMFKAQNPDFFSLPATEAVYFLAWTTTPWTLPANCGLTVGADIEYSLINTLNPYTHQPIFVVLATALIGKYLQVENENLSFSDYENNGKKLPWRTVNTYKGKELEGLRYHQLLSYSGNSPAVSGGDPFRIILGEFVTTEDGTGIVHTAPAFGADDYRVGMKNNLGMLVLVDKQGKFIDNLGKLSGRYVKNYKNDHEFKEVDVDIAIELKVNGLAFKVEKYEHSYPHCWRTDKPIIYYPLDAWFIRTTAVKERMIELNKTINWKPKSTGEGRFGNWLENMVDWNLSRSRYWGTPLPVWVSEDEVKCIGSIEELKAEVAHANDVLGTNQFIIDSELDLHKPYVDKIILASSSGKAMYREPDLIDVWFDSGAMPYAQWHYPFENKELVENGSLYPADFIAEGVDQTRGWFYTLHALSVMLFDKVAYKTVVSNGLVLDKNGNKMSKRVGNVIDPFETIDKYSADATRWYLVTNASPWDSLRFDVAGIQEVQRKFFGTLFNTYQFFALYANVDDFAFSENYIPVEERPELDQWILSALNTLVKGVNQSFDDYEPTEAGRAIERFLDDQLSNWYVRLCRRRFWKGEYEKDKIAAYQTLYECLITISKLMAPVAPFFGDWLYRALNERSKKEHASSVHLADFPVEHTAMINADLEEKMQLAQDISSLVLSLRKKLNIRVRQPLQKILIPITDSGVVEKIKAIASIIIAETNVKSIEFISDQESFIKKKLKPDFKILGARLGKKMKAVALAISDASQEQIKSIEHTGSLKIELDGEEFIIDRSEVEIIALDIPGWVVATKDTHTVALDINITNALQDEGNARELVNRIQKIRKDAGFELTDRIAVRLEQYDNLNSTVKHFGTYIKDEILADTLELVPQVSSGTEIEVNEKKIRVEVLKNNI